MCQASDGCTIITRKGRDRVLAMILQDHYYRLTHERDIVPGTCFFDTQDVSALMSLIGAGEGKDGAESVFHAVRGDCDDLGLLPDGLDLVLKAHSWTTPDDGGVEYAIFFRVVDS